MKGNESKTNGTCGRFRKTIGKGDICYPFFDTGGGTVMPSVRQTAFCDGASKVCLGKAVESYSMYRG